MGVPADVRAQLGASGVAREFHYGLQAPKDTLVLFSCLLLAVSVMDPVYMARRRVALSRRMTMKEAALKNVKEASRVR